MKITGEILDKLLNHFHGSVSERFENKRLESLKKAYEILRMLDNSSVEKEIAMSLMLGCCMDQIWLVSAPKKERVLNERKFVEAVDHYCRAR